ALSGAAVVRDLALNRRTARDAATPVAACGRQLADDAGESVSAAELGARIAAGAADVVDVRTGAEYRALRVRGARHVPLDTLTTEAVAAGRPAGSEGPAYLV